MVDALHTQQVKRLSDIGRRPFLAGMRNRPETGAAGTLEHPREFGRRVAALRRVQTDAHNPVPMLQRLVEGALGRRFVLVAQEAADQPAGHAIGRPGVGAGAGNAIQHGGKGDTAGSMRLGVKKNLGMANAVAVSPVQIGAGQIIEVFFDPEHGHAGIVEIQEFLKVAEVIGGAHVVDAVVGQVQAVAPGQRHHQFRLERALYVQVQFGLRQAGDEIGHGTHSARYGRQGSL